MWAEILTSQPAIWVYCVTPFMLGYGWFEWKDRRAAKKGRKR
jgi:hypothetical protein